MGALASRKGPVTTAGCSHRRIMVDGLGRIDGWWNDLPPRVMSVRFSFPESWSSTPLAKKAVPGTAQDIFVLDNAFVLIEGQPPSWWCTQKNKTRPAPHTQIRSSNTDKVFREQSGWPESCGMMNGMGKRLTRMVRRDDFQNALRAVEEAIGSSLTKNPAAEGGKGRAEKLPAAQKKETASKAPGKRIDNKGR
jgi:hypothetical protein